MSSAVLQYKRPDIEGGVITNPAEIEYYKQVQTNDVINNYMLGDFNSKGNYVIKREIVEELLRLTKIMQHSYGKTLFCTAAKEMKKYGILEFAVKINKNEPEQGKALATLELLEPINKVGGYYQNINTVLLATYTDLYNVDFLEKVYLAFNVTNNTDDDKGRKKINDDMDEILARKDYLLALQKLSELNLSATEKKFYEARIKALEESGELGKFVFTKLQLEIKKMGHLFLQENSPRYFQKMNQLLDKILEESKTSIDKTLLEKLEQAQKQYILEQTVEMKRAQQELTKVLPENVVIIQLDQQKKAEQKQEASKPIILDKGSITRNEPVVKVSDINVETLPNAKGKSNEQALNNKETDELLNVKKMSIHETKAQGDVVREVVSPIDESQSHIIKPISAEGIKKEPPASKHIEVSGSSIIEFDK